MSEYSGTGFVIFGAGVYAFLAAIMQTLTFWWQGVAVSIFAVFVLETIVEIIDAIKRKSRS